MSNATEISSVAKVKTTARFAGPAFAIALGCVLIGAAIRLWAARDFLWLDELHTAWAVGGTLSEVAARAHEGNQTPLYFWLVCAATKTFGSSAIALRSFSLLCGVILLVVLPLGVHRMTHSVAATLLIAVFLIVDYDMVFYSSEARPYALVQLLGVLQAASFFAVVNRYVIGNHNDAGKWIASSWWILSVLSVLLIYAHITGIGLLIAEVIFVVGACVVLRKWPARQLWWAVGLFGVLAIPVGVVVATAWSRKGNWESVSNVELVERALRNSIGLWIAIPLAALLIDRLFWYLVIDRRLSLRESSALSKNGSSVLPMNENNVLSRSERRHCYTWLITFVTSWAIVPVLTVVLMDRYSIAPLALGRYAIVGAVAFPLVAALLIGSVKNGWLQWICSVAIGVMLVWNSPTISLLSTGGLRNENWSGAVSTIEAASDEGRSALPILLAANLIEDKDAGSNCTPRFQAYLKFPILGSASGLANPVVPLNSLGPLFSSESAALVRQAGGGWLIVRDLPESVSLIIDEINASPDASGFLFEHAHFDQPNPNYVQLFRIRVR